MASDTKKQWIRFEHPIYKENKNLWIKYQHSFDGGESVKEHLVQHPREDDTCFEFRQKVAAYINLIAPPLTQILDAIYQKPITRDLTTYKFLETLEHDIDRRSTNMTTFFRQTVRQALLKGKCSVLIDRISPEENQPSRADLPERDRYPYCYRVDPEQIMDWRYDQMTGELIAVKIIMPGTMTMDITEKYASADIIIIYTRHLIYKYNLDGDLLETPISNPLGYIPLVTIYADERDVLHGLSMVRDIVPLNLTVYNKLSHVEEFLEYNALAELWLQGATQDFIDRYIKSNSKIKSYPKDTDPPMILQAAMGTYESLMDFVMRQVATIYNMYKLRLVNRDREVAESGISKEFDLIPTNQQLANIASRTQTLENDVLSIVVDWEEQNKTLAQVKEKPIVKYPEKFETETLLEEIEKLLRAETLQAFPRMARTEATKLLIDKYFEGKIEKSRIDEMKASIDVDDQVRLLEELARVSNFTEPESKKVSGD